MAKYLLSPWSPQHSFFENAIPSYICGKDVVFGNGFNFIIRWIRVYLKKIPRLDQSHVKLWELIYEKSAVICFRICIPQWGTTTARGGPSPSCPPRRVLPTPSSTSELWDTWRSWRMTTCDWKITTYDWKITTYDSATLNVLNTGAGYFFAISWRLFLRQVKKYLIFNVSTTKWKCTADIFNIYTTMVKFLSK